MNLILAVFCDSCIDIKSIIEIISFITALFLFIRGFREYRKANRTKRAEFLENLIKMFDESSILEGKKLLDDFIVSTVDKKIIDKYSQKEIDNLPCYQLPETLRYHLTKPITDDDELLVRESLDKLLDFFAKLSYYYSNDLVSRKELKYFKYYIDKINYHNVKSLTTTYEINKLKAIQKYIELYFDKNDYEILFEALKE